MGVGEDGGEQSGQKDIDMRQGRRIEDKSQKKKVLVVCWATQKTILGESRSSARLLDFRVEYVQLSPFRFQSAGSLDGRFTTYWARVHPD